MARRRSVALPIGCSLLERVAVFPAKSAKIRCMSTQPIATAVAAAFVIESGENEGRMTEIRSAHRAAICCKDAQVLPRYRDRAILGPNVSYAS